MNSPASRRRLSTSKAAALPFAAIPLAAAGLLNPMIAAAAMAFSSVGSSQLTQIASFQKVTQPIVF